MELKKEIVESEIGTKELVFEVAKCLKDIKKKKCLDFEISNQINSLVSKQAYGFQTYEADWMYANHSLILGLMKEDPAKELLRILSKNDFNKNVSKVIKELGVTRPAFYRLLKKFEKLNLVKQPENYEKGDEKILSLNIKEIPIIIASLRLLIGEL